jgi:hypothetical protein
MAASLRDSVRLDPAGFVLRARHQATVVNFGLPTPVRPHCRIENRNQLGRCRAALSSQPRFRSYACAVVALLWLAIAGCQRGRAIGQPCDRGDTCESGVCTIGLGYSDAICTQRCRGEGKGTCPAGWQCAGAAKAMASPSRATAQSICVPDQPEASAVSDASAGKPALEFDKQ